MLQFLPLLEPLIEVLKKAGILRDPVHEAKVREQLAEIAAKEQESFVEFIRVTTPPADQTPRWVNGLIALTRPAITWVVIGSVVAAFFIPGVAERIAITFGAFGKAGTAGMMFLAIPLFWFFGRSAEKIFLTRLGINGESEIPPAAPSKPAIPYTSGSGFKKEPGSPHQ